MTRSEPVSLEVSLADRSYPVLVGRGLLDRPDSYAAVPTGVGRALVVTQAPVVAAGHVEPVEVALRARGIDVVRHELPDGEMAKVTDVLHGTWRAAAAAGLGRGDLVVAVGGGVVGDLAGFAAATWNRGVAVLQVPTTLLAQVDAAIGGKTGINLPDGKNLVGAFWQPVGVVCDVSALTTLSPRLRTEGLGEVVKYGLIRDPRILELIEGRLDDLQAGDTSLLEDLVRRSVAVKADVVSGDETEQGARAHLNLGHTFGHVIEALTGYEQVLHGEAVAMGTVVALQLGVRLGHTPGHVAARGEAVLHSVGLPTRPPRLDRERVWEVMARDKKATVDGIRFVVLDDLARPIVVTPPRSVVDAVLDEITVVG